MKKILLLVAFAAIANMTYGQYNECEPDVTFQDEGAGVYPGPYDEATAPDGGITSNACVNGPYGFVFTVVVANEITLNGAMVALDSIVVNDVTGLPPGMTYSCNEENCTFAAGTIGCATVWGIPQEAGDFDLTITGTLYGPFFPLGQTLSFPSPVLAPGTYTITVLDEGSADCLILDNDEVSEEAFEMILSPNPVSDFAQITVISNETTAAKMVVRDLTGKAVVNNNIHLVNGENNINFEVSTLPNGIYLYSIENGDQRVTKKMIVQK